jgi:hypothetical protein
VRFQPDLGCSTSLHARQYLPFAIGKNLSKCPRNRSDSRTSNTPLLVLRAQRSVLRDRRPLSSIENVIHQYRLLPPSILRYRQRQFTSTSRHPQIPLISTSRHPQIPLISKLWTSYAFNIPGYSTTSTALPNSSPIFHPKGYNSTRLSVFRVRSLCALPHQVLWIQLRMIKQPGPPTRLLKAASCFAHTLILPVVYQSGPHRVPKQDVLGIGLVPYDPGREVDLD